MNVVAVANRKGGVAKTTTSVHLAAAFARRGFRVLVVDLDAQATATLVLSTAEQLASSDDDELGVDIANVLAGECALSAIVRRSTTPGVLLAPSSSALSGTVSAMQGRAGRETSLRRALRQVNSKDWPNSLGQVDFVVVDTPPESHLGTANALVAADFVLVPFTPDPAALHGLVFVQSMLQDIEDSELGAAELIGCLQVDVDARLHATTQARDQIRELVGRGLFKASVRSNAKFISCAGWHKDVFQLERQQGGGERRGTADYLAVAGELLRRIDNRRRRA